jgi:hypothetical protein
VQSRTGTSKPVDYEEDDLLNINDNKKPMLKAKKGISLGIFSRTKKTGPTKSLAQVQRARKKVEKKESKEGLKALNKEIKGRNIENKAEFNEKKALRKKKEKYVKDHSVRGNRGKSDTKQQFKSGKADGKIGKPKFKREKRMDREEYETPTKNKFSSKRDKQAVGSKGISVTVKSRKNSDKIPLGKNKNIHVTSRTKKKRLGEG